MPKFAHQHPFTNLRLAVSFVSLFGFPFAVLGCFTTGAALGNGNGNVYFLPVYIVTAALVCGLLLFFTLSSVTSASPRRLCSVIHHSFLTLDSAPRRSSDLSKLTDSSAVVPNRLRPLAD